MIWEKLQDCVTRGCDMTEKNKAVPIQRDDFLKCHNFTQEQFNSTGLDWSLLEQVHGRHTRMLEDLQSTASYISQRLQLVPAVHSIKVRIKEAEHLVAKIIRKKLETPDFTIELPRYENFITDLIGIRALHLFKDEWLSIHKFVTSTWELLEPPLAYVREGDSGATIKSFEDAQCKVERHPFGYRSIHYLIKSQPAKCTHFAELQVRTIFEEGWSEIDHRVRYPRQSDDPYLADFLTIFNRLAGSADEMGTFIKGLSAHIRQLSDKVAERDRLETQLKEAVSQLRITEEEKNTLKSQIEKLSFISLAVPSGITIAGLGRVGYLSEKTCAKCGKPIKSPFSDVCEECKKTGGRVSRGKIPDPNK
jgi:ppGpp synthetase/RelA/SpoT-type nucleotidyltranferase